MFTFYLCITKTRAGDNKKQKLIASFQDLCIWWWDLHAQKKYKSLPENFCQVQHICSFAWRLMGSYCDKGDSFDRGVRMSGWTRVIIATTEESAMVLSCLLRDLSWPSPGTLHWPSVISCKWIFSRSFLSFLSVLVHLTWECMHCVGDGVLTVTVFVEW